MAENDFFSSTNIPPRIGNAPEAGIDFRDLDYVCANSEFLKRATWEEAAADFRKAQPEPEKIASFDGERLQFAAELQNVREEADQLLQQIAKLESLQKQELEALEEIAIFKGRLLGLLPERYREDGRRFLNNFIMRQDEENYFPAESPEDKNIKSAATKLLFLPMLNKFKHEFSELSPSFNAFTPRFDVSADKKAVIDDIERYYAIGEQKKRHGELAEKMARIEQKQQELLSAAGAERRSLDNKLERLKSYYDKDLYRPVEYADVPFLPEKEKFFEKYENASLAWRTLMRETRSKNIHFGETTGLVENDIPVAALYDRRENRILCNSSFCIDEQIFAVAVILAAKVQAPLRGDCDAKSRYLYELCRQAEQAAQLAELGNELAVFLPILKSRVVAEYADEMSAYIGGNNRSDKYARAYVKAFSSTKVRKAAEKEAIAQISAEQNQPLSGNEPLRLRNLTLGEIISPFVSRGAPLLNENAELRHQLGRIPLESKMNIQERANADKDYSLADMNGY
uniref:Uncharacterized protein n=1 Tax=uncultured Alphaproteobacteria bacterium TaxID=91750 RepID=A0A6G8F319_9PROT|nr:hypothetical protein PlAlph_6070 [uncultured Alphaproteobacteria bacterium]